MPYDVIMQQRGDGRIDVLVALPLFVNGMSVLELEVGGRLNA